MFKFWLVISKLVLSVYIYFFLSQGNKKLIQSSVPSWENEPVIIIISNAVHVYRAILVP